jgi:hypothetical protein
MAIIVETGAIVAGANSYVSEAELTTYATDRGLTLTATAAVLLIKAMDYLETLNYIGTKKESTQSLQWPRINVTIDGFAFLSTEIPKQLRAAQMALSVSIDAGADPLATIGRSTKREKVDVLEVEYMDGAAARAIISSVNAQLAKLLSGGTFGNTYRIDRV